MTSRGVKLFLALGGNWEVTGHLLSRLVTWCNTSSNSLSWGTSEGSGQFGPGLHQFNSLNECCVPRPRRTLLWIPGTTVIGPAVSGHTVNLGEETGYCLWLYQQWQRLPFTLGTKCKNLMESSKKLHDVYTGNILIFLVRKLRCWTMK